VILCHDLLVQKGAILTVCTVV